MDSKSFNKINPLGLGMRQEPKTLEQMGISIDRAGEEDWEDFKMIRCESIDIFPDELGVVGEKKVSKEKNKSISDWKKDLKNQLIFLSRCSDKPIGIAKGVKREEQVWSINWVYVNPDFQKRNTGVSLAEAMIKKLIDEIKNKGGSQIRLWVKSSNKEAVKLYQNLGFEKFNLMKSPERIFSLTGNRPDLLIGWQIMELDLSKP